MDKQDNHHPMDMFSPSLNRLEASGANLAWQRIRKLPARGKQVLQGRLCDAKPKVVESTSVQNSSSPGLNQISPELSRQKSVGRKINAKTACVRTTFPSKYQELALCSSNLRRESWSKMESFSFDPCGLRWRRRGRDKKQQQSFRVSSQVCFQPRPSQLCLGSQDYKNSLKSIAVAVQSRV